MKPEKKTVNQGRGNGILILFFVMRVCKEGQETILLLLPTSSSGIRPHTQTHLFSDIACFSPHSLLMRISRMLPGFLDESRFFLSQISGIDEVFLRGGALHCVNGVTQCFHQGRIGLQSLRERADAGCIGCTGLLQRRLVKNSHAAVFHLDDNTRG